MIFLFDPATDMQRIKQSDIDVGRQDSMVQKFLVHQHGVLRFAKLRKSMGKKVIERLFRLFCCDCKPEGFNVAKIVRRNTQGHGDALLRDLIKGKARRLRHQQVTLGGFPVFRIKIPLSAFGLVAVHQQSGLPAHVAVEVLHAQFLAFRGPLPEGRVGADETCVFHCFDELQLLAQAPFAGFGHHHI